MSTQPMFVYVSEPQDLNIQLVNEAFSGTAYQVVAGDSSFSGSHDHNYEVLLLRSSTKVDSAIRDYFPALKHVIRAGVGLDNIDQDFCRSADIQIYNAPGANADAVSDYTVAVILLALRKLHKRTVEDITSWNRFKFIGQNVQNQTVGIVGFGHIGKLLYQKLQGFNCQEFLIYDPYLPADAPLEPNMRLVELSELLQKSTVISLHLPLTPQTKHVIGKQNLGLIQENAILINASRGGIVDETALMAMLANKDITYVADVVEDEPQVNKDLLKHPNIFITPHIASLTDESERQMIHRAVANFLEGHAVQPSP